MQLHGSVVANILIADNPPDPQGGIKRSNFFFQSIVMLHIKIFGITNAATYGNKPFSHRSLPRPWGGVKIQLFQNIVMVHFILKGITNATIW